MRKYLLKRVAILVFVFFGVTLLVFLLANAAPGSPVDAMVTPDMTPAQREALYESMGLNDNIMIQYWHWLTALLHGNMGHSYRSSRLVLDIVTERIGPTILLTGSALLISVLIGVTLGIVAACRPYSAWDYIASGLSFIGVGVPSFFMALIVIYVFAVQLKFLPTGGMYTTSGSQALPDLLKHLILPSGVLTLSMVGNYIRQTRSAMLEVMGEEYIKMARVKGMRERTVKCIHALKNAMLPIITTIGMSVPTLIGGSVVIEQIFGWPGIGSLMVVSVTYRDYPVIMCITTYICIAVLAVNLLNDILYAFLDPRVRNG